MSNVEIPRDLQNEQWVRMPKPKGRLLGLSRTTLLELAERREIKIANIRKPGSLKGIRLVWMPSLREFLERASSTKVFVIPRRIAAPNVSGKPCGLSGS
jgi:hypothetical protein